MSNMKQSIVKYDQYTVCDGPTCKGKETFMFAGGNWWGSEGQKMMSVCLPLPTVVQKKRGALNPRNMVGKYNSFSHYYSREYLWMKELNTIRNKRCID